MPPQGRCSAAPAWPGSGCTRWRQPGRTQNEVRTHTGLPLATSMRSHAQLAVRTTPRADRTSPRSLACRSAAALVFLVAGAGIRFHRAHTNFPCRTYLAHAVHGAAPAGRQQSSLNRCLIATVATCHHRVLLRKGHVVGQQRVNVRLRTRSQEPAVTGARVGLVCNGSMRMRAAMQVVDWDPPPCRLRPTGSPQHSASRYGTWHAQHQACTHSIRRPLHTWQLCTPCSLFAQRVRCKRCVHLTQP
jgi:hypothetical protein